MKTFESELLRAKKKVGRKLTNSEKATVNHYWANKNFKMAKEGNKLTYHLTKTYLKSFAS